MKKSAILWRGSGFRKDCYYSKTKIVIFNELNKSFLSSLAQFGLPGIPNFIPSTFITATDLHRFSKRKRLIQQTLPQNNNPGNGPIWLIFLIMLCWMLNYAVLNRTNTY